MTTTGPNVLASVSNQSVIQGYRPRLIEFYGYEGEDFRHFQEILDSYLAVNNTQGESRKIAILKSQLRRAAKVYFERVILKEQPEIKYDQAIEALKNHYITPELIQSYEMEFNDMFQGEQEHPQIFLARLREAADLANIDNEALIESRFRAGLLNEIKNFCIQSSSKNFKDWLTHSEGWWNANRPRKIAMVDNPFIPRNINNALIYHNDNAHAGRYNINNHNVELVDIDERPAQILPVSDVQIFGKSSGNLATNTNVTTGVNRLSTMEVVGYPNDTQYHVNHSTRYHHGQAHLNNQQEILNMIQQAIRNELNTHDQYNRPYNRNARNNYNNFNNYNPNVKDNYQRYNNNNNSNHNYYSNNGYNNNRNIDYSGNNNYNGQNNRFRNNYNNGYERSSYNSRYRNQPNSNQNDVLPLQPSQQNQPSKN